MYHVWTIRANYWPYHTATTLQHKSIVLMLTSRLERVSCNDDTWEQKRVYVNPDTWYFLLLQCWGYFRPKYKDAKIFENHLNPAMLVCIGKILMSTTRWVPICQGFSDFPVFFMHHFVWIHQMIHQQHMDVTSALVRVNIPWDVFFSFLLYNLEEIQFQTS